MPYVGIGKFVAIGLNYTDHAKEAGLPDPVRADRVHEGHHLIIGPNDDVIQPRTRPSSTGKSSSAS